MANEIILEAVRLWGFCEYVAATDARWLAEMKAMRTGSLGAVSSLVDYINSFRP